MATRTPQVDLPPAGHARDEVLRERTDNLEQLGEETAAANEVERIDPAKLRVENEIAQHFDPSTTMLNVSNKVDGYIYCWVYSGMHGLMITQKTIEGWVVVQGSDPEAEEHKGIGADTTRRVGDTILMRVPMDVYLLIQRRQREQANRFNQQQSGISDKAQALADRYKIPIYDIENMDARTLKRMMNKATAQNVASKKINTLIRQGRMPGAKL